MIIYVIKWYNKLVVLNNNVVKFVKFREVGEILGVNVCILVRWEKSGEINFIKILLE